MWYNTCLFDFVPWTWFWCDKNRFKRVQIIRAKITESSMHGKNNNNTFRLVMKHVLFVRYIWCSHKGKKPPAREKIMRLKRNQQIITLEKKQTFLIHIVSIVLCEFDDPLTFPMIFSLRILINELWWSKESEWMNK